MIKGQPPLHHPASPLVDTLISILHVQTLEQREKARSKRVAKPTGSLAGQVTQRFVEDDVARAELRPDGSISVPRAPYDGVEKLVYHPTGDVDDYIWCSVSDRTALANYNRSGVLESFTCRYLGQTGRCSFAHAKRRLCVLSPSTSATGDESGEKRSSAARLWSGVFTVALVLFLGWVFGGGKALLEAANADPNLLGPVMAGLSAAMFAGALFAIMAMIRAAHSRLRKLTYMLLLLTIVWLGMLLSAGALDARGMHQLAFVGENIEAFLVAGFVVIGLVLLLELAVSAQERRRQRRGLP